VRVSANSRSRSAVMSIVMGQPYPPAGRASPNRWR
jgi:hypothetical protein